MCSTVLADFDFVIFVYVSTVSMLTKYTYLHALGFSLEEKLQGLSLGDIATLQQCLAQLALFKNPKVPSKMHVLCFVRIQKSDLCRLR